MLHASPLPRPDLVISTGRVQPYPLAEGPGNLARGVLAEILGKLRLIGPIVSQEAAPEEIAMAANRLAIAMAAGYQVPKYVAPGLVRAAILITRGEPFQIQSAGRSITVTPTKSEIKSNGLVEPLTRNV